MANKKPILSKKIKRIFHLKITLKNMHNLKIYCMCLDNEYLEAVKKHNYIPVGLKIKIFQMSGLQMIL